MRRELVSGIAAVLAGGLVCAAGSPGSDGWSKALRKRGLDPAAIPNPIAVTPDIERAADAYSGGGRGTVEQLHRIQRALFDDRHFTFDYESALTYTAAEALAARRGNCVSFTNLFIAMARSRGMRVRAGYVRPHGTAEKRGDLVYVSTHVVAVYGLFDKAVIFDFYRTRGDPGASIRLLDDFELAALYVNNRAVEAMSGGDLEAAERGFDAVVKLAPRFAAAYGNLGVLRRRRGDVAGALDAYGKALALEPRDPAVLGNLAALYFGLGREREARAALAAADLRVATPFTILARGDIEAAGGRVAEALKLYRRAARQAPDLAEPYVAIARLEWTRGRVAEARRALARALKLAPEDPEAVALREQIDRPG